VRVFELCTEIEKRGLRELEPFIKSTFCADGRYVRIEKSQLAKELQKTAGDLLINCRINGALQSIEVKVEEKNGHGNLFLELWSNRSRGTHGWMHYSKADWLFYYFLAEHDLYVIDFPQLKHWAFETPGYSGARSIDDFPLRKQTKHFQFNDTWGVCVPIQVIKRSVGFDEWIGPPPFVFCTLRWK
jgi:hypothetical protein